MTMDARKQRVLQAIVALYGLEGEPVVCCAGRRLAMKKLLQS